MAVIPVYLDFLRCAGQRPLWPCIDRRCLRPHRRFFDGITQTWGAAMLGRGGLRGAVERSGEAILARLARLVGARPEDVAAQWLEQSMRHLPGPTPDLFAGVLFFFCPACTLSVQGRPAIALGLERFVLDNPEGRGGHRFDYVLDELAEMVPHEACHAARMLALSLPPSPGRLDLKEMLLLEGTALVFTDWLLGRQPGQETLRTFLPPQAFADHARREPELRRAVLADAGRRGMGALAAYFAPDSPTCGYYVGWSLCRDYLGRYGQSALPELITLPSDTVLQRLTGDI